MRHKILGWIGILWGGFILANGLIKISTGQLSEGAYAAGQVVAFGLGGFMLFAGVMALRKGRAAAGSDLRDFARRYTDAWCSQNPSRVASCYAEHGALTINGGTPAVGRTAIAEAAREFMNAFPDMVVTMDRLEADAGQTEYHWTLTGTNTGPGGSGRSVRISGYEEWLLGPDGLIVDSQGHFDQTEYNRQLGRLP
jgi:hypothetical protein